jgi:hypothetical protein
MANPEPPALGGATFETQPALVGMSAYQALGRRGQRRLILGVLVRVVGITTALLLGYFLLPLDWDGRASGLTVLIIGLVGLAVLTTYHVRAIVAAQFPQLRAVEALAILVPSVIVTFAYTYVWLSNSDPHNFTQPIDRMAGIYFVVTVLSTVGFGDIAAVSSLARGIVTLQMLLDLVFIGIVAKLIFGASRIGVARRQAEAAAPGASPSPPPAGDADTTEPGPATT